MLNNHIKKKGMLTTEYDQLIVFSFLLPTAVNKMFTNN